MPNYRRHYHLPLPVFVTIVTHDRQPWLLTEADTVLAAMRRVKAQRPYRHLAHVSLPDHLHWLFAPPEPDDLSRIVAAVKREVSWRLKARGMTGLFWQNRFYDHPSATPTTSGGIWTISTTNPCGTARCARPATTPIPRLQPGCSAGCIPPIGAAASSPRRCGGWIGVS